MIAIVDYGVGNLFSLKAALDRLDVKSVITGEKRIIEQSDKLILPGVGAFGDAYDKLKDTKLVETVINAAKVMPILGICLGMQLLFSESSEFGFHTGLNLIEGKIASIETSYKIPHMGWNSLKKVNDSPILKYVEDGEYVYYVHSYMAYCDRKYISAVSDYGTEIVGAVRRGNVYGTQFHPEKSGDVGMRILRAFSEI